MTPQQKAVELHSSGEKLLEIGDRIENAVVTAINLFTIQFKFDDESTCAIQTTWLDGEGNLTYIGTFADAINHSTEKVTPLEFEENITDLANRW